MVRMFFCRLVALCSLGFCLLLPGLAEQPSIDPFLNQLKESLEKKNIPEYLSAFAPEIRDKERESITAMFDELKMIRATVYMGSRTFRDETGVKVYLNIFFENSYAAVIEVWLLNLREKDGIWQIDQKTVTGDVRNLYKVSIPSGRAERVKKVEIQHVDVKIIFEDAVVFYDNIPDIETALFVMGEGRLYFSPSVQGERHQLDLIYGKEYLSSSLDYIYLRFSDSFFKNNIHIVREEGNENQITQQHRNRAYELFSRYYFRSFTIENSLNGKLISVLPQGDEAVFEFAGQRIGEMTYIFSPFAQEEVSLYQRKKLRFICLYSPRTGDEKRLFISFEQKFDTKNYQIDIDFTPKKHYLSGKAKIAIESKIGLLTGVRFKLNPELEILRICDQNKNDLFYTKDTLRKTLYIYFLNPVPKDETSWIEIYYRGTLEPPQQTEDVLAWAQYDERFHMMIHPLFETYLYSQSSFWYPVPPDEDYFTARLKILVPSEYSVISNGLLVGRTELKETERVEELEKIGRIVHTFQSEKPLKYLSFIVGRFRMIEEGLDTPPMQYYRTPEVSLQRLDHFSEARRILQFYEKKFGPYPFEKLSIVQRVWRHIGGHSPASFIVLNELPSSRRRPRPSSSKSPVDLSRWSEYFLAHEIAHQWWGQGVTWKTYRDLWISEGLAQFSAILYLREKHGEGVFSRILKQLSLWTEKKSKWGPVTLGSRLSYSDFEAFQSVIYNKSSLVLNMLKDILGEDAFFEGMRQFFDKHKYSAARTSDFINVFLETSAQELRPFFRFWLSSHVLPEVKVSHSVDKGDRGYVLRIKIIQINEVFVFPLWVEWEAGGKTFREKLIVDQREVEFSFESKDKPNKVNINPDDAVPGKFY